LKSRTTHIRAVASNAKKHTANMKLQLKILTILILIFSATSVKADTWSDPSWKQMLEKSDLIVLAKVTNGDDFKSEFKIEKVYKGNIDTSFIWVTGYSNKYGPIDKKKNGEKYILFLTQREFGQFNSMSNYKTEPQNSNFTNYYKALEKGNAYSVWTPTSGDLRVERKTVQYDLLQTSYYGKQNYYPLAEFETFLKSTSQNNNSKFHEEILKKVRSNATKEISAQYLMMLHLTSFKSYDSVFETIANEQQPEPCYALAQLLGKVDGEKSRDILVKLLDNENSVVQGEVVRQLSNEDPEFIGPILLSHLDSAGEGGIYPSNLMDPVMKRIDGGKIEIIRTLGEIKYKPAAKTLLPLLETEEDYIFELVINVLIQLDNKDFIPYINDHLKKRTKPLIFEICQIITDNDLKECKPALMEFISKHNRNDHPSYEYAISTHMGLAHFDDQETRDFLLNDFENLLNNNDTIESSKLKSWIREYIETFKNLKSKEARPLIYNSLFKWFGYNFDFAVHPVAISV
jgi:hypothetical protein